MVHHVPLASTALLALTAACLAFQLALYAPVAPTPPALVVPLLPSASNAGLARTPLALVQTALQLAMSVHKDLSVAVQGQRSVCPVQQAPMAQARVRLSVSNVQLVHTAASQVLTPAQAASRTLSATSQPQRNVLNVQLARTMVQWHPQLARPTARLVPIPPRQTLPIAHCVLLEPFPVVMQRLLVFRV